jgi:glycosyltransferase involved in cell wall biosynthesis
LFENEPKSLKKLTHFWSGPLFQINPGIICAKTSAYRGEFKELEMSIKRASVIIPTYNRAHVLKRALDSVAAQTFKDFDLWIIDDGSTDNTEAVVRDFASENPQLTISYRRTENSGVSAARNHAIRESRTPWLAFLDSDDEWLPEKLEKQFELASQSPNLRVIHGEEIWIRNGNQVMQGEKHKKSGGWIFERCLPLCLISPSAVMIHRSVFDHIGLFEEDYPVCEDYDLWLKMTLRYEVGYIEEPIIKKFGGHSDQLSQRFFAMDYWRVKAMGRMLTQDVLYPNEESALAEEIMVKSEILLRGYEKHNNMQDYAEVVKFQKAAQGLLGEKRHPLGRSIEASAPLTNV